MTILTKEGVFPSSVYEEKKDFAIVIQPKALVAILIIRQSHII